MPDSSQKHNHSAYASLVISAFILFSSLVRADDHNHCALEEQLFNDCSISNEITGIPQQPHESPGSITVITRQQIEDSGFIEIIDLLRQVPGFQVAHYKGNNFVLAYHGQATNFNSRLDIRIDGHSIYRPLFSSVDWTNLGINIEDIEKIHIVRGSNVASQGSNAFTGAINFITRKARDDEGIQIKAIAGSQSTQKIYFRTAKETPDYSFNISGAVRADDGFEHDSEKDRKKIANINATFTLPAQTDGGDWEFGLSADGGRSAADSTGTPFDPERDTKILNQQQFVRYHKINDSGIDEFHLRLQHSSYQMFDEYQTLMPLDIPGLGPQFLNFAIYHGDAERYEIELHKLSSYPTHHMRTAIMANLRHDRLNSFWHLGHKNTISETRFNLSANIEKRLLDERIILNTGTMIESNNEHGTHLSPRFGLNFKLNQQNTLRFSYTQGIRLPSIIESNNYFSIWATDPSTQSLFELENWRAADPDLEPERIDSYEIGYHIKATDNFSLDAKLFKESTTQVIREVKTISGTLVNDHFVRTNTGYVKVHGLELQFEAKLSEQDFLSGTFTRMQGKARLQHDWEGPYENDDAIVPKFIASLQYRHKFANHLTLNTAWYHLSSTKWLGNGDELGTTNRVDVNFSLPIRDLWTGGSGKIRFGVQNIGNTYPEFEDENIFDTRLYLQVEFNS